jgi:hypothetical protein
MNLAQRRALPLPVPPPTPTRTAERVGRPPAAPRRAVAAATVAAEPPPPTPAAAAAAPVERRPADLAEYWNQLKQGGRLPSWSKLDSTLIADRWPNSLLLSCGGGSDRLKLQSMFTEALRTANRNGGGDRSEGIEFTPMLTEWVLSLGREASRRGTPIADTEPFPSLTDDLRYRAVALPLSDDGTDVDHVLCHVERV